MGTGQAGPQSLLDHRGGHHQGALPDVLDGGERVPLLPAAGRGPRQGGGFIAEEDVGREPPLDTREHARQISLGAIFGTHLGGGMKTSLAQKFPSLFCLSLENKITFKITQRKQPLHFRKHLRNEIKKSMLV